MLRLALLAALLAAPAHARDWAKAACDDDLASCRETCTMEDGTDLNSRGRLDRCLVDCKQQSDKCEFKRFDAQRKAKAPKATVLSDSPSVRVDGQPMTSTVLPAKGSAPAAPARHEQVPSALDPMPRADFTPMHRGTPATPPSPLPPSRPARETDSDSLVEPSTPPVSQPAPAPAVVPAPNYDRLGGSRITPAAEPAHKPEAALPEPVPAAPESRPEEADAAPAEKPLPVAKTHVAEDDHIDDLIDKPATSTSSQASETNPKGDEQPAKKKKDLSEWGDDDLK